MQVVDPENRMTKKQKKEILQLHEDVECIIDGFSPHIVLDVLVNLAVSIVVEHNADREEFLEAIGHVFNNQLADKEEENGN